MKTVFLVSLVAHTFIEKASGHFENDFDISYELEEGIVFELPEELGLAHAKSNSKRYQLYKGSAVPQNALRLKDQIPEKHLVVEEQFPNADALVSAVEDEPRHSREVDSELATTIEKQLDDESGRTDPADFELNEETEADIDLENVELSEEGLRQFEENTEENKTALLTIAESLGVEGLSKRNNTSSMIKKLLEQVNG